MSREVSLGTPPVLNLYIQYDQLLAEQLSAVINGLSRAYGAIAQPEVSSSEPLRRVYRPFGTPLVERLNPFGYPPLSIQQIETGSSIKIGFGIGTSLKATADGAEITLPRWTAALVLVGSALVFGLNRYEQFLRIEQLEGENQKIALELNAMTPLPRYTARRVDYQLRQVRDALAYPTIRSTTVNGIPLR
jgi:hypothetical protein